MCKYFFMTALATFVSTFISMPANAAGIGFDYAFLIEKNVQSGDCALSESLSFTHYAMPAKKGSKGIYQLLYAEDVTTEAQQKQNQWVLKFVNQELDISVPQQIMYLKITASSEVLSKLKFDALSGSALKLLLSKTQECSSQRIPLVENYEISFD